MSVLVLGIVQTFGSGILPSNVAAQSTSFVYLPLVRSAPPPCDPTAIAQLRSITTWQGEFSIAFNGNASGPWPSGDSEVVNVSRTMRFTNATLVKTFDSATFVRWKIGQRIDTGQFVANDSDVYTFAGGTISTETAQFTVAASTDVLSIHLYPDQCKLRFELDGQAIGPVVGGLLPNAYFEFCATLDVPSPRVGVQSFSSTVPIYLSSATGSAFEQVYRAGLRCRVGGGDPNISPDLFAPSLAWVLDGGTTSGTRGKGDAPLGMAQVTYTFVPQP